MLYPRPASPVRSSPLTVRREQQGDFSVVVEPLKRFTVLVSTKRIGQIDHFHPGLGSQHAIEFHRQAFHDAEVARSETQIQMTVRKRLDPPLLVQGNVLPRAV